MESLIKLHYGNFQHVGTTWNGNTYYGTCWRLCYTTMPEARLVAPQQDIALGPDHLYLTPPRLTFSTRQLGNPKLFYLHFDTSAPYDQVESRIYPIACTELIQTLLDLTMDEVQPQPDFLTDRGTQYAIALTAAALAEIPRHSLDIRPMDPRIRDAIQFMNDRINSTLTVQEIAKRANMNPSSFIRLFKQGTGKTPYAYVTESRITWACELLTQGALSIDQIAEYTGFNDRFHFSKVFKRMIHQTPVAYRERQHAQSE